MKMHVISHVTLVMSLLVVTQGSVKVMVAGVVLMHCVLEVKVMLQVQSFACELLYIVPCPPLTDPVNGTITCSLGDDGNHSYEDICSFTCNTGYELTGSGDSRTCQRNGSWSGNDAMCARGNVKCIEACN